MDIEELARELYAAFTVAQNWKPYGWENLVPGVQCSWRLAAQKAMEMLDAAKAPVDLMPRPPFKPPADLDPDEARALRERVIMAVYATHHGMPAEIDLVEEADWLISYVNGQSP